jgi:hypothetical protein
MTVLLDAAAGPPALDRGPRAGVRPAAAVAGALASALAALPTTRRAAALALAHLWHDDLDAAHGHCQAHEDDADCNYVHALLHRREGDFANAKYWFREVGPHPTAPALAAAARAHGLGRLLAAGAWSPAAVVDACAKALRGDDPAALPALVALQADEFRILAAHLLAGAAR